MTLFWNRTVFESGFYRRLYCPIFNKIFSAICIHELRNVSIFGHIIFVNNHFMLCPKFESVHGIFLENAPRTDLVTLYTLDCTEVFPQYKYNLRSSNGCTVRNAAIFDELQLCISIHGCYYSYLQ